MVLLCAHDYAKHGAALLMKQSGVVLELSDYEQKQLQDYVAQFKVKNISS